MISIFAFLFRRVKFGVPLDEVCKNDIPGPLLVLILKLNKEAPLKKDIFRAPGHQGNMKKLIHFLQTGHLVNMDNFSVYTIASVLKKFLCKIPGGVFGKENEMQLFTVIQLDSIEQQRDQIHKLITSLPIYTQRLLVLLFGTFRVVAVNSERAHTGMTSEALGVSVAPSFFQSCVSDGKTAKMEDVLRFKVATRVTKFMIDNFGVSNLFGRHNYEFYARITGRILKVEEDWIFSFRYPPATLVSRQLSLEAEKTWLQFECQKLGLKLNLECMSQQEESQSTPALIHMPETVDLTSSLGMIPENTLLESCTRLSVSLEENGLFQVSSRSSSNGSHHSKRSHAVTLEELRAMNRYAESTKSLSYLPQVHERQAARMRTRSEWFLTPVGETLMATDSDPTAIHILRGSNRSSSGNIAAGLSASAESIKRPSLRRTSSREKQRLHRSSSRRNKENGAKGSGRSASTVAAAAAVVEACKSRSLETMKTVKLVRVSMAADQQTSVSEKMLDKSHNEIIEERATRETRALSREGVIGPQDCTEMDVQTFHVTLTYKPRI
ncbi:Rho GTPase-activating protein [Ooceraea biroi]|uniref:Rho GTPase-activating protein n=1 Tax=Ooceraea biroi TaxID=2015173 RepID=A0A026W615_OOCBI|nr:Rho GTPase-activating protein [Ooceraea biroi]